MGDKRSIIRWVAASIVTLVAFLSGSSGAADLSGQGNVRVQTPVMPNAYQLPKLVAGPRPPTQPIPFSHAHHAGTLALECATCHVGAGANADKDGRSKNGKHVTLPGTQICMNCHIAVATDRHNMQTLAKYHAAGEGVPWIRVYRVLEGVKWTHKPHLGAGIKCQKCHGDVGKMEVMAVSTTVTAMASCLNCHRATQVKSQTQVKSEAQAKPQAHAKVQCETCHAWPSVEDFLRWPD